MAYRLYLPEIWATDPQRRVKAGIPQSVVLADAGYGIDTASRIGLRKMGLDYVVGIQSSTSLWPQGQGPMPPKPWSGKGRPPSLYRRDNQHKPISAKALAKSLPSDAWQIVTWREGTNTTLTSRFAAVRVRLAHRDYWLSEPHAEEWLMIEWPDDEMEPTRYWLSSLEPNTPLQVLVGHAKLRWRIERDYQDMKQELGLGHYEVRGWRGFHHHATLCIAAYAFLVSERSLFPPPDAGLRRSYRNLPYPKVTNPADLPMRTERHVADSIATIRVRLILALSRGLQRCPCCQRAPQTFMTQ